MMVQAAYAIPYVCSCPHLKHERVRDTRRNVLYLTVNSSSSVPSENEFAAETTGL